MNTKHPLKYMRPFQLMLMSMILFSSHSYSMEKSNLQTMNIGKNSIRYLDTGEGRPIIFIHGWSSHMGYWKKQIEEFSKTNRIIAYEWRGMGGSSGGKYPFDFTELIEDLRIFIEKLELEQKPLIVGHSLGGLQAIHLASTYPEIPSAIISIDAPGRDSLATGRLMYWSMITTFRLTGFLSDPNAIALQTPINRFYFYSPNFINNNRGFIELWEEQFKSNSVEALINSFKAMSFRKRTNQQVTDIPALFVLGSEDRFISQQQTEDYMRYFSASKLKIIPEAGHMSSEEQPDLFNKLLKAFLTNTVTAPVASHQLDEP